MKVCVTAKGETLDSEVDPRFGRCQFFLIIDTETMTFDIINNNGGASSGAGVHAGQLMVDNKVEAVLTGAFGPKASAVLESANIKMIANVTGKVEETIKNNFS